MAWLACLLALWTAVASVAPTTTDACESPRCRCCERDRPEGAALERPPCCEQDDCPRAPATPVIDAGRRASTPAAPVVALEPFVPTSPRGVVEARATELARGPPALALHLLLGRLLL